MQDMQLEIDILKETINVLKKDPDIDQSALSNREKAVIIDVLKNRYSLPLLLQKLQLSKSSYYYQEQSLQKEDKYTLLRVRVIELFTENKGRYGYRRIHALLKRENIIVSEKVIRRIMKEEQLVVKIKRTRKYNSYPVSYTHLDVYKRQVYQFTVKGGTIEGDTVIPDYKKGTVVISKVDVTTAEELPGAQIEITDKDGNRIYSGVSDEYGKVYFEAVSYTHLIPI